MKIGAWVVVLCLLWVLPASAATTLTTYSGVTITWTPDRTIGTYANGDYYIVGSISLTSRTGQDTTAPFTNGCQVNPDPPNATTVDAAKGQNITHGFDERQTFNPYDQSGTLNICDSFPTATIATSSSIMIATSLATCTAEPQCLAAIDVVTVVASAPVGGSSAFRPPFAGTDKSFAAVAGDIRYDVLHDYVNGGSLPTIASLESACYWRNPLYILASGTQHWEKIVPTSGCNTPRDNYYRGINWTVGETMAALNTNATDAAKATLAIRFIQQAIDIYGEYLNGEWFGAWAGFCGPQKEILIFGASLLNNAAMMAAAHPSAAGQRFCTTNVIQYIDQGDINLNPSRPVGCGTNALTTATAKCVLFTQEMIGLASSCTSSGNWVYKPENCSATNNETYGYMMSGLVPMAMILSEMSLEEEVGWPAFFDYLLGRQSGWAAYDGPNVRLYPYARTHQIGNDPPCTGTALSGANVRAFVCELMDVHLAAAATNGSITGGPGPSNVPPSTSLTGPQSGIPRQYQTGATIALVGTSADSDGTVSSTTATATCDASVTATGTATAWTRTVDLPLNTVCTISIVATDDDAATSIPVVVDVLRVSNTCPLVDNFSLTGIWTAPNPYCWTMMFGALSWENSHLRSTTAARNFFLYTAAVNADQMTTATLDVAPGADTWVYVGVRGSVSGANYSGMGCTAQNPISYVATFVDTFRTTFETIDMTATPWVAGDTVSCRAIGQQYCLLRNGVVQGTCQTDGASTFTGGGGWVGAWGTSAAFDNVAITAQAGGGDIVSPLISMTTPAGATQVASTPYTATAGTASDAVGVTGITWVVSENLGENGTATPTPSLPATSVTWAIASVDLIPGNNTIQVTAVDAAGNSATTSQVVNYVPASSVTAGFTYPNAGQSWTQVGALVDLAGTMTPGECTSVLMTNVSNPDPAIGGFQVVATGADTWAARVRIVVGENLVRIDCMDGPNGTGTSKLPVTKTVTSVPLKKRR